MRIVAVSDLHLDAARAEALVAASQGADLVIGAGDFAQNHDGLDAYMARLAPLADRMIVVPGNNETLEALRGATDALVLHGGWVDWNGVIVAGLGGGVPPIPPQPWGSWDLDEAAAGDLLDAIPVADVLVTHSPPYGMGDDHAREGRIGSTAIKSAILRLKPALSLFGHVHDCWGESGTLGPTRWRNLGPDPVWFDL
ncbi:Predicted phosphoesterase [Palleronia salina]|uniref:Predicted phosphoesterase n=1 Tax=Palleronia salina TaxID=313368 RepID=A0A1M6EKF6_9RHOB|nr:metallophosphoesterase [Palleronia salina]SHI85730.1 Predicted phosphoesterase [Palleronia salina]